MFKAVLPTALLIFTAFHGDAHAYMDPGSGSLVLQLLIGGVAGVVVIAKIGWKRIRSFFFRHGK